MTPGALFVAVFLACTVEAVEALTIVLAAGAAREWRSTTIGLVGALIVLAAIAGLVGPAVASLPLRWLRLVVGALLLVFGLQWLRKAILRAARYKGTHDEQQIFEAETATARAAAQERRAFVTDWYAFTLAFKGVMLEGLEVVFIAVTLGSNSDDVGLAAIAALAAVAFVAAVGVAVRAPLARVPENAMKFVVGVLLASFGTFWGAEGAGAEWPGGDAALAGVVAAVALLAIAAVAVLRHTQRSPAPERVLAGSR